MEEELQNSFFLLQEFYGQVSPYAPSLLSPSVITVYASFSFHSVYFALGQTESFPSLFYILSRKEGGKIRVAKRTRQICKMRKILFAYEIDFLV